MLGRLIEIFISSNLKKRQVIFHEFFMTSRKIMIFFFLQICQAIHYSLCSLKNQPRQLPWLPWW